MIQQVGGIDAIIGIGVGAPNGNIYSGAIEYAPNLQWKGIIPLASFIQIKFGLPTTLTNDANAAALGEMMYGATKNVPHFIMITLGTGVGSGIVIDGKIVVKLLFDFIKRRMYFFDIITALNKVNSNCKIT